MISLKNYDISYISYSVDFTDLLNSQIDRTVEEVSALTDHLQYIRNCIHLYDL